jgi:hypothetical protein
VGYEVAFDALDFNAARPHCSQVGAEQEMDIRAGAPQPGPIKAAHCTATHDSDLHGQAIVPGGVDPILRTPMKKGTLNVPECPF